MICKSGDRVKLITGSPEMVVTQGNTHGEVGVTVTWWNPVSGSIYTSWVDSVALIPSGYGTPESEKKV